MNPKIQIILVAVFTLACIYKILTSKGDIDKVWPIYITYIITAIVLVCLNTILYM
jgi:hypothetical protein